MERRILFKKGRPHKFTTTELGKYKGNFGCILKGLTKKQQRENRQFGSQHNKKERIFLLRRYKSSVFTKRILEVLTDGEYKELQQEIANNPKKGNLIPAGGGLEIALVSQ